MLFRSHDFLQLSSRGTQKEVRGAQPEQGEQQVDGSDNPEPEYGESILGCVRSLCSCNPRSLDAPRIHQAVSGLIPTSLVLPQHMSTSAAISQQLLPASSIDIASGVYTESDRLFIGLSTKLNWPQDQAREVLSVLRNPKFSLDDLQPDLLRQVNPYYFLECLYMST